MMVRHRLPPQCRYSGHPRAGWPIPNSNAMARAVGRSAAAWDQQRSMRACAAAGVSGRRAARSGRSPRETLTVIAPRPGTFPAASSHACCRPAWTAHRHSTQPEAEAAGAREAGANVAVAALDGACDKRRWEGGGCVQCVGRWERECTAAKAPFQWPTACPHLVHVLQGVLSAAAAACRGVDQGPPRLESVARGWIGILSHWHWHRGRPRRLGRTGGRSGASAGRAVWTPCCSPLRVRHTASAAGPPDAAAMAGSCGGWEGWQEVEGGADAAPQRPPLTLRTTPGAARW